MSEQTLAALAARHFVTAHPAEAAQALVEQPRPAAAELLSDVAADVAEPVLRHMDTERAARVLLEMPEEAARAVLLQSDFVRVARWLSQLSADEAAKLQALLPEALAKNVKEALEFPPGTAGEIMDARVLGFSASASIGDVLKRIRQVKNRRITDVLVVDEDGKLQGTVSLQALVGSEEDVAVGGLMQASPSFVTPMANRDEVVQVLQAGNLASLPVVAVDGTLLGILRHDALVRAAQDQVSTDLQQMVGAGKEERALSTPFFAVKSRLPWLLINLLTAFAAAAVVGLFDSTIARFTALAVLMPVVAGQSGNTGAQALAVTSRGLALREIRTGHWLRVVVKESVASVINGVSIAVVTGIGVYLWSGSVGLMLVIGISMVISMLLAAIAGAAIPVVLTALDKDPATASSIVLTTVTDVAGFFSFLGLATLMAGMLEAG